MENLQKKFQHEYLGSVWQRLRFWFLVRKVRRQKVLSLWESNLDKMFFETQYPEILSYEDSKDRQGLKEERQKPLADQNEFKIADLERKISHAKAIKDAYYKNEGFHDETMIYIKMLERWMTGQNSD